MLGQRDTWVCLGDSITQDPNGYVSICEREIKCRYPERKIRVVNAGVSGDKSSEMLARFARDVLSYHPDWVSISVGVNDVWHGFYDFDLDRPKAEFDVSKGNPLPAYRKDLESMIGQLETFGVQIILIAPTVIGNVRCGRENAMLDRYVHCMEEIARQHRVLYCPMNDLFWKTLEAGQTADPSFALTTDGVHMNEAGANMMAVGVLTSLGFYEGSAQ